MKRKLFDRAGAGLSTAIFAVLLLVLMVLAGCATTTNAGRYDNTSPEQNDCTLVVGKEGNTMITKFDGQTVSWQGSPTNMLFGANYFIIAVPAGEHTLSGGPTTNVQGTTGLAYETSTKFKFEAGKTYFVSVVSRNFKITAGTL
jgi:hypothetical protein